jgi:hypothetical protein
VLAFLPAALVLVIGMTSGQNGPPGIVLWSTCVVSVACCFASSFMLFRRKAKWASIVGTIFVILNGMISFFLGCAALVNNLDFR